MESWPVQLLVSPNDSVDIDDPFKSAPPVLGGMDAGMNELVLSGQGQHGSPVKTCPTSLTPDRIRFKPFRLRILFRKQCPVEIDLQKVVRTLHCDFMVIPGVDTLLRRRQSLSVRVAQHARWIDRPVIGLLEKGSGESNLIRPDQDVDVPKLSQCKMLVNGAREDHAFE
jgi:hypothetical protein